MQTIFFLRRVGVTYPPNYRPPLRGGLHFFFYFYQDTQYPENKKTVDHIDRDTKNNCIENLRWAGGVASPRSHREHSYAVLSGNL
jgi:hypothetical protein